MMVQFSLIEVIGIVALAVLYIVTLINSCVIAYLFLRKKGDEREWVIAPAGGVGEEKGTDPLAAYNKQVGDMIDETKARLAAFGYNVDEAQ